MKQTREHLRRYLRELLDAGLIGVLGPEIVSRMPSGRAILESPPAERTGYVVESLDYGNEFAAILKWNNDKLYRIEVSLSGLRDALMKKSLPFNDEQILELAKSLACNVHYYFGPNKATLAALERFAAEQGLPEQATQHLSDALREYSDQQLNSDAQKAVRRLEALVHGAPAVPIIGGEPWADAALDSLGKMSEDRRDIWLKLLNHCQTNSASPSAKWLKQADSLTKDIHEHEFHARMLQWLPLVDKPRQDPENNLHPMSMIYANVDVLRGLVWCFRQFDDVETARLLGFVAVSSYKKGPGYGPRAIKVGNAAVYALGSMPGTEGLAQLALLKVKIKFGTAQQGIEKALKAVAARLGMSREEIEELAVPTYGMSEVGIRREEMSDFIAELRVSTDGSTTLEWEKADGKKQKSVPAALKDQFAEELKELKAAAKDIEKMLPAQKERIDGLFLAQKRWPVKVWRERYLDHPLVGIIARRLIWDVFDGESRQAVCSLEGRLVDASDRPVEVGESANVELWHPIGRSVEEIVAWRQWLERHQIQQPLKQAHREVYLLTDAERRTETYSNRFAAHLIRQHQFNALCGHRGWKNKLRLMVDDAYPAPSRSLPLWGLRAEFWVESAGTEFGVDTNDTGTFLYLATDQVRFYPLDAEQMHAHASGGGYAAGWGRDQAPQPLRLDTIPPLVFSEIMRDVDLFVGVASVGNDPTWADGGPQGRYVDYWQRFSFGELSASAQTRKNVLSQLVPRLKIADRCSFVEKFLVVRGDLRTYKVHLGSGNILMEPNDQYLCIVPDRRMSAGGEKVFLPFEGDATLSIILSKALLLAEDKKITDPTITRQISPVGE